AASGLSMDIRRKRFCPPPLSSISTISIPAGSATRPAMASIFERIGLLMLQTSESNKKVGFRPLDEFDTYTSIVSCPEENATYANCGGDRDALARIRGPSIIFIYKCFCYKAHVRRCAALIQFPS